MYTGDILSLNFSSARNPGAWGKLFNNGCFIEQDGFDTKSDLCTHLGSAHTCKYLQHNLA